MPPRNKLIILDARRTMIINFFVETRINETNAINYFYLSTEAIIVRPT